MKDWKADRERWARFAETEIGKLYVAHSRALINYWQHDADEHISDKRLADLAAKDQEATRAFLAKLMELAGVS